MKKATGEETNQLGFRPAITAEGTYVINDKWSVFPGLAWMYQKKAQEFLLDVVAAYDLPIESDDEHLLYVGSIYRAGDAWAPLAGYQYNQLRVLLNYDINLSSLTSHSHGAGGFELSIVYTGLKKSQQPGKLVVPCPRM